MTTKGPETARGTEQVLEAGPRRFESAIREDIRRRLEALDRADIVVGVPCFNNQETVDHVVRTVNEGIHEHFPDARSAVLVSDGGSTDDTREQARAVQAGAYVETLVGIYRGVPGKGSALRQILEAADFLDAKACVMLDADLRSISPLWIKNLVTPVLEDEADYVAPHYQRYKWDGTITNNIVYFVTRSLFGKRVRQPIGGDFAFGQKLIDFVKDQDVWSTDVGRFGIDIWLTVSALVQDLRVVQARLGVKIHDPKDPAKSLGAMFQQVVGTIFEMAGLYTDFWKGVEESREVPVVGEPIEGEPVSMEVDVSAMIERYRDGWNQYGALWEKILKESQDVDRLADLVEATEGDFHLPHESWNRIVYDFMTMYHCWRSDRHTLVRVMTPLYLARVASYVNHTRDMEDGEAEALVEKMAAEFEEMKDYFRHRWEMEVEEVSE